MSARKGLLPPIPLEFSEALSDLLKVKPPEKLPRAPRTAAKKPTAKKAAKR